MSIGLQFAFKGFREFATWYGAVVGQQVDAVIKTLDANSTVDDRTKQLARLWGLNSVALAYAGNESVEAVAVLAEKPATVADAQFDDINLFMAGLGVDTTGDIAVKLATPLVASLPGKPEIPIDDVFFVGPGLTVDSTKMTIRIQTGPALIEYQTSLTFMGQDGITHTTPPMSATFHLVV